MVAPWDHHTLATTMQEDEMGVFDELKGMADAAEKALGEHPDQVKAALSKLEDVIDKQTGGSHHDQIAAASAKADAYIDKQSKKD